jgi:hypothetical protein
MLERLFNVNYKIFRILGMAIHKLIGKSIPSLIFRHYINLLIDYPFGIKAKEIFDIDAARKILE